LTTTVLPQARAGPTFQVISSRAFHGLITPITPLGLRTA
jgi:formylmethanofuran dehydrogenase subunit E